MKRIRGIAAVMLVIALCLCSVLCTAEETLSEKTFKVAGVTYANDDGSDRQFLLFKLEGDYLEWGDIPGRLEPYEYEGRPAIYVYGGDFCIGNIPADNTAEVMEMLPYVKDVIVRVSSFKPEDKTIYYARVTVVTSDKLQEQETPPEDEPQELEEAA